VLEHGVGRILNTGRALHARATGVDNPAGHRSRTADPWSCLDYQHTGALLAGRIGGRVPCAAGTHNQHIEVS
jgi:hypothetical protein